MTVTNVTKDAATLTMVVTAEFNAPIERVWELWADPRQLERWWGPPGYPATFVDHDLAAGGTMRYFMTSPEGEKFHAWWRVVAVDAPRSLEMVDGFGDSAESPNPDMPETNMRVGFTDEAGATQMVMTSTFASADAMEKLMSMGMDEGLRAAMSQMDDILAA